MIKGWKSTVVFSHSYVRRCIQSVSLSCLKDDQSHNVTIVSLCKQKFFKDALQAFNVLEINADSVVELSTYANLFSACSSLKSLEYGRKIHNHVLKLNLLPNMILENHIINMYGKCASMKDARNVFDNMRERNVVTWTALIAGYSQNGLDMDAIKLYLQIERSGLVPDHFTFGSVIKAFGSLKAEQGAQLHCRVVKSEFGSHTIVQNALIAMYTKFGGINEACDVFSQIKSKDLISWSSMIAGFSKLGYELEALYCFKEMLFQGIHCPNEFIFGSVFSACGSLDLPEYGRQIHGISVKLGFQTNIFAGCSMTDMYAKCGFLSSAKTAFDKIKSPDIASWNAIISGFAYNGHENVAMSVFSHMRHLGFMPDDITVRSLLCGFFAYPSALSQGKQVHSYAIKTGLDLGVPVCNTLLTMYANCLDYLDACKMFDNVRDNADLVSWNAILTMCMHQHQITEVFLLFRNMLLLRIAPDHITLVSVLGACRKVSTLEMGDQIFCCAVKHGLDFDIMVMNALIDMYVKCGSLESGRKIFDCVGHPDVFSWTSLLVGYAQFGYGEEALNLFQKMKNQGIKPNQVTLVGVLTACSHVGLVEEGLQLFKSMEQEHGVSPTREHCSCVIDLLARRGHIHEAEAFILEMGFDPDIVIWKTLLAACRSWGNIEVAKRVVKNILKIDPTNSTAYVLLCSIYASAGIWKDVATMRTLMRETGVKKVPGRSWIEVKDGMHAFSAEDGLHPDRDRVFAMLEELWLQILDARYDPSLELCLPIH